MRAHWASWVAGLVLAASTFTASAATAILAGGCFWCMEEAFEPLEGVAEVTSGYIGGDIENPTYYQVSRGETGHTEAVRILYAPEDISYTQLLTHFWRNIDPTDGGGQFCDRGSQYRSGVFYLNESQRQAALESREALRQSGRLGQPIVTEISAAGTFYPAEGYHQDYYRKNKVRYSFYKYSCGRAKRLETLWGATD